MTDDRINSNLDLQGLIDVLGEGDSDAEAALLDCNVFLGFNQFQLFCTELDAKRLYGYRIWELYELCGQNAERFIYHVDIELPNQETGAWRMTGPYALKCRKIAGFTARRQFGQPNSFWALQNPPTSPEYEYPVL